MFRLINGQPSLVYGLHNARLQPKPVTMHSIIWSLSYLFRTQRSTIFQRSGNWGFTPTFLTILGNLLVKDYIYASILGSVRPDSSRLDSLISNPFSSYLSFFFSFFFSEKEKQCIKYSGFGQSITSPYNKIPFEGNVVYEANVLLRLQVGK